MSDIVGKSILEIVSWYFGALWLEVGGRVFGGRGTLSQFLSITGFARIPLILIAIIGLILSIPISYFGGYEVINNYSNIEELVIPAILYMVLSLISILGLLWFYFILFIGIKEAHNFSFIKSIGLLLGVIGISTFLQLILGRI